MQHSNRTPMYDNPAMVGTTGIELSRAVAELYKIPDSEYFARPEPVRNLAALLHTLFEDEQLDVTEAANIAGVPYSVAARYRSAIRQ